ncbi:MAG: response regulator transcription factor [Anaerolineales bacterium]|nr:response regulator transcription factor [Anaerolineales bacterium]
MSDSNPIRVMIVDDHLMVRDGLRVFLSVYDDIKVIAEADDGEQAVALCRGVIPDVVLMDLLMPNMDGIEATRRIRSEDDSIQVIALTSFAEQELVEKAFRAGAISYLMKDVHSDKLAETIREAKRGRSTIDSAAAQALVASTAEEIPKGEILTPREREILVMLTEGKTNKEIANQLSLSEGTVRFHVSNILSKMGVNNRTEAVSLAFQQGLI